MRGGGGPALRIARRLVPVSRIRGHRLHDRRLDDRVLVPLRDEGETDAGAADPLRVRRLDGCASGAARPARVGVVLDSIGAFALAEFGFFLAFLGIANVYIWKKGALEWR